MRSAHKQLNASAGLMPSRMRAQRTRPASGNVWTPRHAEALGRQRARVLAERIAKGRMIKLLKGLR